MRCVLAQVLVWGLNPVARWKYRKIPGPPPELFVGHLMQVLLAAPLLHRAWTYNITTYLMLIWKAFEEHGCQSLNRAAPSNVIYSRPHLASTVVQIGKKGGMHNALLRWAHDFGPIFKFFLGRHTIVVINGAYCGPSGCTMPGQCGLRHGRCQDCIVLVQTPHCALLRPGCHNYAPLTRAPCHPCTRHEAE